MVIQVVKTVISELKHSSLGASMASIAFARGA